MFKPLLPSLLRQLHTDSSQCLQRGKELKCHSHTQVTEKNKAHQLSSYPMWCLGVEEKSMFQVQETDEQYLRGILLKEIFLVNSD